MARLPEQVISTISLIEVLAAILGEIYPIKEHAMRKILSRFAAAGSLLSGMLYAQTAQVTGTVTDATGRYALDGLSNKILAAEYRTALPKERTLVAEIERTLQQFDARRRAPRRRARRSRA